MKSYILGTFPSIMFSMLVICFSTGLYPLNISYSSIQSDVISNLAWSTDNQYIAAGYSTGLVRIIKADTLNIISVLQQGTTPYHVLAWSPDGKKLAGANGNGNITLWDTKTWLQINSLTTSNWNTHPNIGGLIWSSDSQYVTGGISDGNILLQWNAESGALLNTYSDRNAIGKVAWNPGQTTFISANGFSLTKMDAATFNVRTRVIIPEPPGKGGDISSIAWSEDGKFIVSGSRNGIIRLWDATTNIIKLEFPGSNAARQGYFDAPILSVGFSPDSSHLTSVSADGTIRNWTVFQGSYSELALNTRISSGAWDDFGVRLAYAENKSSLITSDNIEHTIKIIVPYATGDDLHTLIDRCVSNNVALNTALAQSKFMASSTTTDLEPSLSANLFTDAVNALPAADITVGCRADLLALSSRLQR